MKTNQNQPRRRSANRRAMTLIEATMSLGIVAVMMVAALRTVGASARARQADVSQRRGPALARQLMSEIAPTLYSEPTDPPNFGPEGSENDGTRAAFDDVDDYHNWSSNPPQIKDGTAIPGLEGWTRSVKVTYVDPDNMENTQGRDTGLKRISVTATDPQGRQTTVTALRSSFGLYAHPTTHETTYLSWIGVELQVGKEESGRVVSAAHPLNRIPVQGE